ncbi:hypothetical protein [Haliangium sp.]|uniref:hypothetical protein n=1 Tax=Haliangium sp. TaxID=2663208 RepID=UPI003D14277D
MNPDLVAWSHDHLSSRCLAREDRRRSSSAPGPARRASKAPRATTPTPTLLVAGRPTSLRMAVAVTAAEAGTEYRLDGLLHGRTPLLSGRVTATADGAQTLTFDAALTARPEGFVPLRSDDLSWQLTPDGAGPTPVTSSAPEIALVWLPTTLTEVLGKGVPLALVCELEDALDRSRSRRLEVDKGVLRWVTPGAPNQERTAIAEMVQWVFDRPRPRYDVAQGSHHYTDIPLAGGPNPPARYDFDQVVVLLQRYLEYPLLPCNCYDQAAVLQLALRSIGVVDTRYCYLYPFGYLRTAGLVGRGQTNNPLYASNQTEAMVADTDPNRTAFANHTFCRIEADHTIVDSCTGPHLGDQPPRRYVATATDDEVPEDPTVERGTVEDIIEYTGVVGVESTVSGVAPREEPTVRAFMDRVGYDEAAMLRRIPERAVAASWQDPLSSGFIDRTRWQIGYDELLPGVAEVRRHWGLEAANAYLAIDLFVCQHGGQAARERFLSIGSSHTHAHPIFDPVPGFPGHAAAQFRHPLKSRFMWVHHNVVCDLVGLGLGDDDGVVEDLQRWFLAQANAALTDDLTPHRPTISAITVSAPVMSLDAECRIDVQCDPSHVVDVTGAGPGLRLADRGAAHLCFVGVAPSQHRLAVLVVDPVTLLSAHADVDVDVQP